jgi:hypothetical protein
MKALATGHTDDFRKDLMEDVSALGIIVTSDIYIVLNKIGLIRGADKFLNFMNNYQVIGLLILLFMVNLLIYILIDSLCKKEIWYKLFSFVFGSYLAITVYILSIKLGCSMRFDYRIILMEYWELLELLIYQTIFLSILSYLMRIKRKYERNCRQNQ